MKIAVGGMIASGKSSLVKKLAEEYGYKRFDEFDPEDKVFDTLLKWLYEGVEDVEMLLQVYFLHKHWSGQRKLSGDVIVDRHIIEHWLFAQTNLRDNKEILNMYNGLFHQYMNDIEHPDLYIILDMDWDSFEERVMKRGRPAEIENFGKNLEYFRYLMNDYTRKLIAQCETYDIKYVVIDTSDLDEEGVFDAACQIIDLVSQEMEDEWDESYRA